MAAEATQAVQTMKAVQYSSYGGNPASSLKLVNIPVPVPKKGEMLVKIEAASVNPVDWKIQKGMARPLLPPKFPYTPGTDVAGEVVSVGPSVTNFAAGDKVVCALDFKTGGSMGEYAIAAPKTSAKRPEGVSAAEGACLPVAGTTALQALTNSGVNIDGSYKGNVLITAAAGGVGLYAVQLAKLSGAHVTATAGERNINLVKELGADEVLDYKTDEGAKLISPSGKKYDVVVNGASGIKFATLQPQLSETAEVQELNPSAGVFASSVFKKLSMAKQKRSTFLASQNDKDLSFLVERVAKKELRTIVDSSYPLEKAADAWTKSKDGHATGKVVITVAE